jgi:hypothetical protein
MFSKAEILRRAQGYAERRGLKISEQLGFGVHGTVFVAESHAQSEPLYGPAAIKAHHHERDFRRERDVYLRLRENEVSVIRNCHVPELLNYDDDLWVIEMTVVTRPFVLDFAGAFLDEAPDFSEEVLAEWHVEKQEQFGAGKWREVQSILRALEGYGIFLVDVTPNNVALLD